MLRRISAVAMVAVFMAAAIARAEAPDLSTPKKAAVSMAKALGSGDMAAVRETVTGTEEQVAVLAPLAASASAMQKLSDAAVEEWKDAGKTLIPMEQNLASQMSKQVEEAEEKIDGEKATLVNKKDEDPMTLKKIDGKWKVDMGAMSTKDRDGLVKAGPMFKVLAKGANEVTADIKAKKYKTVDEAKQALDRKMKDAMGDEEKKE